MSQPYVFSSIPARIVNAESMEILENEGFIVELLHYLTPKAKQLTCKATSGC